MATRLQGVKVLGRREVEKRGKDTLIAVDDTRDEICGENEGT